MGSDDLTDLLDRDALVRALAESGFQGARNLLGQAAREDPRLAERVRALRETLRRQAARRVGRLLDDYDQRLEQLEVVGRKGRADLAEELEALEARRRASRQVDLSRLADTTLLDEVSQALLLPEAPWRRPPAPPGFLERLRALLRRIAAFFRRLFGRTAPVEARVPGERSVVFARLAGRGRSLTASEVGDAIARLDARERETLRENVDRSLEARERDLRKEAEAKRRDSESQRRQLEEEREEARRRAEAQAEARVRAAEEERLARELKERGFVQERGGELAVTYGLIERFARLVLEEETRSLPGDVRLSLQGNASTGVYEKARLRQPEEVAHLDLPSSLLAARLEGSRHIDERSSYVYREVTSERVHVVLALDKSGSMAEAGKLPAAKKALLALYVAIRRKHPDAVIDVVAFDNEVRLLDLLELWECPPGSFTNTEEALRTAHLLLRPSRATHKEFFLVTDGLPESYTDLDGRVLSGNLDAAMTHALARAEELATVKGLRFSMVLLRSEHPEYEVAARQLTRRLNGSLVVTDPERLGVELLVRWAGGTETVRRPPAGAGPAPSPPPAPGPGRRRRRADRRMGG